MMRPVKNPIFGRVFPRLRAFHSVSVVRNTFDAKLALLKEQQQSATDPLEILNRCKDLQDEVLSYDKLNSTGQLAKISEITASTLHGTKITKEFLKRYWLTNPHFQDLIISLDSFYSQHRKGIIDKQLLMIPFRRLLWEGQIENAISLVDATVASPRYLSYKSDQRVKRLLKYFISCFGFIGGIEVFLRVFFSSIAGTMTPVYFAIAAYIGNMSFLASMAFGNKKKDDLLRFDNGTFQKFWDQHSDELELMSRVVEADLVANDTEQSGFVSKWIVDDLGKRQIVHNEPEHEIMLRQYWLSGGDGFVWVEPDQDPADLMWERHLKQKRVESLPKADQPSS